MPTETPGIPGPRFLEHPRVELQKFRGKIVSAYVQLADRKAVRDIQPQPDQPVFFFLDEDGWPVGATFYAPVEGYVVAGLLTTLLASADGKPQGIDQRVHCDFITRDELRRLIAVADKAHDQMTPAGCA